MVFVIIIVVKFCLMLLVGSCLCSMVTTGRGMPLGGSRCFCFRRVDITAFWRDMHFTVDVPHWKRRAP